MAPFFVFFFLSGFCSLLYQVVWLRLAFAHFGVVTAVISVVVSIFMLGLALGSILAGWVSLKIRERSLLAYAACEAWIGAGAWIAPWLMERGDHWLLNAGEMNSTAYLWRSALMIAAAILPWCIAMGATYPLAMAFLRARDRTHRSFSFLYGANVLGSAIGALTTAFVLVEVLGLRHTLTVASIANLVVAAGAIATYVISGNAAVEPLIVEEQPSQSFLAVRGPRLILFVTGGVSLAMEIIWTRIFTPIFMPTIYMFAGIVSVYMLASWQGALYYRRDAQRSTIFSVGELLIWTAVCAMIPLVAANPFYRTPAWVALGSLIPFCFLTGYLTPAIVDSYAQGDSRRAGNAYGFNVVGCVLGPLIATYLLLPAMSEKNVALILATAISALVFGERPWSKRVKMAVGCFPLIVLFIYLGIWSDGDYIRLADPGAWVHRDSTATVIAAGGQQVPKMLLVNGIGLTALTPITKIMAHVPCALLGRKPTNVLIICFGMGTTYRSFLSWGTRTTAVELVPSVRSSFGYFFSDADAVMRNPKGRVIIDDGRRFLKRSHEQFDIIDLDPPPPVETIGSSLLYSTDFYREAKTHLTPDGILQQWFPFGEQKSFQAIATSLHRAFPYVRVYSAVTGWGYHFYASSRPIRELTPETFLAALPAAAKQDLMEWYPNYTALEVARLIFRHEVPIAKILGDDPLIEVTDDRPYTEYYAWRQAIEKPNERIQVH